MPASGKSTNNLFNLLQLIIAEQDITQWVSATVLTKFRSSYRKPGAMMLVSPLGKTFGLISGGCLEADIVLRARRVLEYGAPEYVIYDSTEDGNIAAELGLGCNGRIGVLVEQLSERHRQLYQTLLERMKAGQISYLAHCFAGAGTRSGLKAVLSHQLEAEVVIDDDIRLPDFSAVDPTQPETLEVQGVHWSVTRVKPPVRVVIAGGGIDARPVAALAASLGWRVTVADHRTVNARQHNFPVAEALIHQRPEEVTVPPVADALIVMSHNLEIDAQWLSRYQHHDLHYIGLLGPVSRKEEVLAIAGMALEGAFASRIHGPMGLDIGGDLPESVAVSVIAQCHQVLAGKGLL